MCSLFEYFGSLVCSLFEYFGSLKMNRVKPIFIQKQEVHQISKHELITIYREYRVLELLNDKAAHE